MTFDSVFEWHCQDSLLTNYFFPEAYLLGFFIYCIQNPSGAVDVPFGITTSDLLSQAHL